MKKILALFTVVISFHANVGAILADQLTPEVASVMDAIIQAHEAEAARVKTGRGTANVSLLVNSGKKVLDEEKSNVRFWFKGQSRRTDFFAPDSEMLQNGAHTSICDNGEFFYRYNRLVEGAIVRQSGSEDFRGQIGKDFGCDVFSYWLGAPLSKMLKDIKDSGRAKIDVELTEKGLLKLVANRAEETRYDGQTVAVTVYYYLLLNPADSYRIEEYHFEQRNGNGPGSSNTIHLKSDWLELPLGQSYPRNVKYDRVTTRSALALKNSPDGAALDRNVETHINITLKEFEPAIDINDSFFSLEGMGVRPGTTIDDQITGIVYSYGARKVDEETLQRLIDAPGDSETSRGHSTKRGTSNVQTPEESFTCDNNGLVASRETIAELASTERPLPATYLKIATFLVVLFIGIGICLWAIVRCQSHRCRS